MISLCLGVSVAISSDPKGLTMTKEAQAETTRSDEVIRRLQSFTEPHTQAVLLARLRIATEATDVHL